MEGSYTVSEVEVVMCKEKVFRSNGGWFSIAQPCSRKAWKDGYCKQHHPDTVAERDKAYHERYQQKLAHDPLQMAVKRIAELEAELATLKALHKQEGSEQ
jgi:hypothetical protein